MNHMDDISLAQTKIIASRAKILFSDDKFKVIEHELNGVLHWIEKIQDVDTDGIEPLINPNSNKLTLCDDNVMNMAERSQIMQNAPKEKYGYFVVPKVIG